MAVQNTAVMVSGAENETVTNHNFFFRHRKSIILHLSVWILYFLYENGIVLILNMDQISMQSIIYFFLLNALIFYINTYGIIPYLFTRKKHLIVVPCTLLLLAFYILVNYQLTNFIHQHHISTIYTTHPFKDFIILRIFRFIYFITLSYAFWFSVNKVKTERQLRESEAEHSRELQRANSMEKEMISTQLNYLRYQINPHFLFNTLSFIYTQVLKHSEEAAQSVLLLSNIMNYALHHQADDGKIEIEYEIQHIKNLIDIHQLRFNHQLQINFTADYNEAGGKKRILPLLLITFVENGFKYGNLHDAANPVIIKVQVLADHILFYMWNSKKTGMQVYQKHHIGIHNIRKRLELAYQPEFYHLLINDEETSYTVTLKLYT